MRTSFGERAGCGFLLVRQRPAEVVTRSGEMGTVRAATNSDGVREKRDGRAERESVLCGETHARRLFWGLCECVCESEGRVARSLVGFDMLSTTCKVEHSGESCSLLLC